MTAIAAVTKLGQTWIGTDAKTFRGSIYFDSGPKMFHRPGWSVAHCDRAAAAQIIEMEIDQFHAPKIMNRAGVYAFGQWVKARLQAHGVKKEAAIDGEMTSSPLELLVATSAGGIFVVCGDGHVSEHKGFWASGAGWQLLIGAIDVLHGQPKLAPRDILIRAIKTSIAHSPYCDGPIHVKRVT